ncbi:hypothetical protein PR048_026188 [Dryococelus australis]|uniref:Uncharacterized protein n=1 Tax=Dryococelus australis TaxID=614101 RepID=A0ABQ9GKN0_9NEOP|nr:hypothetical protein PR048_026188 [Dryococelus australis]
MHSLIEKHKKLILKGRPINVPDQGLPVIQSDKKTGSPFEINAMDTADMNNVKQLYTSFGENFNINENVWNSAGETGNSRENSPTSGIVRHDPHVRKSGSNPAGNRTRFASSLTATPAQASTSCWNFPSGHALCVNDVKSGMELRVQGQEARERYGRHQHTRLAPHRSYAQGVQCFRGDAVL